MNQKFQILKCKKNKLMIKNKIDNPILLQLLKFKKKNNFLEKTN